MIIAYVSSTQRDERELFGKVIRIVLWQNHHWDPFSIYLGIAYQISHYFPHILGIITFGNLFSGFTNDREIIVFVNLGDLGEEGWVFWGGGVALFSYLSFVPNISVILKMFYYFTFGTAEEGIIKHLSNGEKPWMWRGY